MAQGFRLGFTNLLVWLAMAVSSQATGRAAPPIANSAPQPEPSADQVAWGFDLRVRTEFQERAGTLPNGLATREGWMVRARPRVWMRLSPARHLTLTARLISEPRYILRPTANRGWTMEEALFDQFNVSLPGLLDERLTLTFGRQALGNHWLISDGTPTDGSRTEFFDAARVTFEAETLATTFDGIYVRQFAKADRWLPVLNDRHRPVTEQDEQALILQASNRALPHAQLDGFLIFRHQDAVLANGNSGDAWAAGVRVAGALSERWRYRVVGAPQRGRLNGQDLRAWGVNGLLSWAVGGDWQHTLHAGFEYLSGDDPQTAANEGWDPFWGRRPQWSELMVNSFGAENRGRPADYKNLQRVTTGWECKPHDRVNLTAHYMLLLANENPLAGQPGYSRDGRIRGHYVQAIARYTFNRRWAGHLWGEVFWPGDYYADCRRETGLFLRAEMVFSF